MQDTDMIISEEKKIEILLKALEERYSATKVIRERVQNICLWMLGLLVTASGFIFQNPNHISDKLKVYLTLVVFFTVIVIKFFYLDDLRKGFNTQLKVQARIENILGLCEPNVYGLESVYPQSWLQAGTPQGKGNFFLHNYFLLYFGAAVFLTSIWLN